MIGNFKNLGYITNHCCYIRGTDFAATSLFPSPPLKANTKQLFHSGNGKYFFHPDGRRTHVMIAKNAANINFAIYKSWISRKLNKRKNTVEG